MSIDPQVDEPVSAHLRQAKVQLLAGQDAHAETRRAGRVEDEIG